MDELSLHILDVAGNSTAAKASLIEITVGEDTLADTLSIEIKDDGCGMTKEFLEDVTSPFTTTRTTRKVGLGLPLFKMAAELTGGEFKIESEVGVGTDVLAVFGLSHIDRAPVGDMAATVSSLVMSAPDVDFVYARRKDGEGYVFDTRQLREQLGEVPLDSPEVIAWITDYIKENEETLGGAS